MQRRRKAKIIVLCVAGLTALLAAVGWTFLPFASRANQSHFKAVWVDRLRQCHTLQDIKALPQPKPGSLDTRVFADGSWVAISWHCIHDEENTPGGEWDGAVLRDSTGQVYWTNYHFCGYEGFSAEFLNIPAKSLPQFYQNVGFKRAFVS